MDVSASRLCPLCRSELRVTDTMHTYLSADHKRSAAEADEPIDIARPRSESNSEPPTYCAANEPAGDRPWRRTVSVGPAAKAVN
jgi:hypothetical protein